MTVGTTFPTKTILIYLEESREPSLTILYLSRFQILWLPRRRARLISGRPSDEFDLADFSQILML